jgi:hypothetical protein
MPSYVTSHLIIQIFCDIYQALYPSPWLISDDILLLGREDVVSLESVGGAVRAEDVPALALPLWVVDRIDPILDLHDDAAVLLHKRCATLNTLSLLDGECTYIGISNEYRHDSCCTYHPDRGSCTSGMPAGPSRYRA